jgi:hypothetical protein
LSLLLFRESFYTMSATLSEAAVDKLFATKVLDCDDLLCHILSYLDYDKFTTALVSKGWQRCVYMPASWKVLSCIQPTAERWRFLTRAECEALFAQLVRVLHERGCLAQVKVVRAFLSTRQEKVYRMLLEDCPTFTSGDFKDRRGETVCGSISTSLINKWGPPSSGTLHIGFEEDGLEVALPETVQDLRIEGYFHPKLIPRALKSLTTYHVPDINTLECVQSLRKLTVTGSIGEWFTYDGYVLKQLPNLQVLELPRVVPKELENFIGVCPNVESFAANLNQLDQMRACYRLENYIELLKRWQLKTLSLVLEGCLARDETRDYDAIRAYILEELPTVEHLELLDKRP